MSDYFSGNYFIYPSIVLLLCCLFFETESYYVAVLEHIVQSVLPLNSSCLFFLSAGVKGVHQAPQQSFGGCVGVGSFLLLCFIHKVFLWIKYSTPNWTSLTFHHLCKLKYSHTYLFMDCFLILVAELSNCGRDLMNL